MSKRKTADDHNPDCADGAKKPRTEGAAAAKADVTDSHGCIKTASADLVPCIARHTLKLVDAMHTSSISFAQRMHAVADLLQADASRSRSLIDLSLVPEGDEVRRCSIRTGSRADKRALTTQ